MHPFIVLLHLAAAVMLLLWAVRMVRTGMERAHGAALRDGLRRARGGMAGMALAGMALAVLLQSATAVGVLAAGFAASGLLPVASGLAALLGADLGSALVVRLLSFDLSALVPVLLLAGTTLFLKFESRLARQTGRIILGIGFILLSLRMIGEATEPLRESAALPAVMAYLQGDALTAFALVAVLTWAVHSSVAVVLLLATLTVGGVLPLGAAVPMVLGANLGAGLIAVWLTRGMSPEARRIPLGNLIFRAAAALAALGAVLAGATLPGWLGERPDVILVNLHLAFNACLLIAALPFASVMARATAVILPAPAALAAPAEAPARRPRSALDRATLPTPRLALASAKRELLLMGDTVEEMYAPVMDLLAGTDTDQVPRLRALDDEVNARHSEIKLFIAEMNRGVLSEEEARRGIELTDFAINLEHAGDIVAKTLLTLVEEKARKRLQFSDAGWTEMTNLHARVLANLRMAMNVLVSGDAASALQLMREKETLRRLERESHDRHLKRLESGNRESIATSDMHLEVVRAFKEINSLLVTVAHPILAERGLLLDSRLAEADVQV